MSSLASYLLLKLMAKTSRPGTGQALRLHPLPPPLPPHLSQGAGPSCSSGWQSQHQQLWQFEIKSFFFSFFLQFIKAFLQYEQGSAFTFKRDFYNI